MWLLEKELARAWKGKASFAHEISWSVSRNHFVATKCRGCTRDGWETDLAAKVIDEDGFPNSLVCLSRGAFDAELLHPATKRVGMELEDLGRASWSFDYPPGLFQDVENGIFF